MSCRRERLEPGAEIVYGEASTVKGIEAVAVTMRRTPWLYVPTLYFAEGLPYIIVITVSTILYKNMGMSNRFIGFTSVLYLPWAVKMLWSPLVDIYGTKRSWIVTTQLLLAMACAVLAAGISSPVFVLVSLAAFTAIAFLSATHDIAADGFYMLALDKQQQAFFLGVRSTCYRIAMVFGSGVLVVLAGTLEKKGGPALGWSVAMAIPALLMGCLFLFHRQYLPRPGADSPCTSSSKLGNFREAFSSYFRQDRIIPIVGFILVYRLGEAMLLKMVAPFLLDGPGAGGLGLATDTVGYVYGTVGVISLSVGGILGGVLIARFGLKKCIWPLTIILHGPDAAFVYLSSMRPELFTVYIMVAIEQFGYGMGFTAFGVFLMYIARGPYKTSHFAISTSLMALGMMLPGMLSGMLQQALGYTGFFITVLVLTVPGMVLLLFIPLEERRPSGQPNKQG